MIKKTTLMLMMLFTAYSFSQTVLNIPIANSSTGSGEEQVSDGDVSTSSSDLEFYHDANSFEEQIVGLHFENVNVPKGATITNAYIQFQADQEGSGNVTVNIEGDASDNAGIIDTNDDDNISGRTPTTANEDWVIASWVGAVGDANADQRTPDIKLIISEIIGRTGWDSGNNMAFRFTGVSRSSGAWREAESGSATGAPVLHIEFITPPAEIDITGNGNSIANGDDTPDASDDTQFGNIGTGQTFTKTFSIKNEGGLELDLSGSPIVAITGDSQFTVITQPSSSTLGSQESVDFVVEFAPTATSVYNATISIDNDDSNENPYTFDIQGTGATSLIDLNVLGNTLSITNGDDTPDASDDTDFGSIYSFIERTRTFTIENTGNSLLTISSVTSSNPDFTISSTPSATVGIGASTTFEVTFDPSSVATISSTITINSDDQDENPFTFDVEGQSTNPPAYPSSIIAGNDWFYLDDGSNQGTEWQELSFDQAGWTEAPTEIGYGDTSPMETTTIGFGPDSGNKYITSYFRKYINIADASVFNSIDLEAIRDDGMVVYLNGSEIWRDNMSSGTISYNTLAGSPEVSGTAETTWITNSISSNSLVTGVNMITVEIHQQRVNSSDISFNFKFTPSASAPPVSVVERGPYLQSGSSNSVIVKWRTDNSTESIVNYGTSLGSLSSNETDTALKTEHEVTLTGLTPNTTYYYNIANLTEVLSESLAGDMYITTAPTIGTETFVRAWILGDAGTANQDQRDVRDAYYNYVSTASTNPNQTDMMLFLGDNAYNSGTDSEYQNALFDIYDDMLQKSVSWSCLGNHDGYSADSNSQTGTYYDIFTFPTAGESGGLASGTEAYYAFDYANIHFIVLDSYETSRSVGGTMYNWAQSDIQNTTQDWIVVLFHHPPYTKGSHNSDTETELIQMRENFMPMLEDNGVDLVLSGHSHCYERSYFLNGHNGASGTFDIAEIGSGGNTVGANGSLSGKADTADGAYLKTDEATEGAVYITTGSAGKETGGNLNHAAMYHSVSQLGSCIMEVESDGAGGQNLTVKFLRETEAVGDYFTINKSSVTLTATNNQAEDKSIKLYPVPAKDLLNINVNLSERLKTVKFYNNIGKLVKQTNKETINVSNIATGMYVVEIATDKNTYYKSIIIE